MGSTVVAVRDSASGALNYLLGDQLGSTTTSVNASTGAASTQRFLPYGAPRSGSITATDRGWIGQTKDASTGLQYLNARYYDPTIGRFTATDPLADLSRPASFDGYGYGYDNPATLSDPSGLRVPVGNDNDPDSAGSWDARNPRGNQSIVEHQLRKQIRAWLREQAPGALIGKPTAEFNQYRDWSSRCRVFDEHYCVGAQALTLGSTIRAAEDLMGQCTIGNLCRTDGVVRDHLTELLLIDIPSGLVAGFAAKGLISVATARGLAPEAASIVGETTAHGATRIVGPAATRGGVLSTSEILEVRTSGALLRQADGAAVRVLQQTDGRFSVVVDGERGLVTSFKNLSQNSLDRLAKRYEWMPE